MREKVKNFAQLTAGGKRPDGKNLIKGFNFSSFSPRGCLSPLQDNHPGRGGLDDKGRPVCAEEDHGEVWEEHQVLSHLQLCVQNYWTYHKVGNAPLTSGDIQFLVDVQSSGLNHWLRESLWR